MKKLFFILFINLIPAQQSWTLKQCLDYASANHPLVKQSTVSIQKNERQISAAKGMLLPSVNAGVSHNYGFGSSINQNTNQREAINSQYDQVYAQASWELLNWRNYLGISLSRMNKESSIYTMKRTQNEIKLNVIQMFFAYQNSKSWLDVLQTQISGIEDQIRRTEKEVEIGSRPKSDVYDIRANLGTMQEQWVSAKNQRDLSKINLLNALSVTKDTLDFAMPEENLTGSDFNDDSFVENLLNRNPAYQSITQEIQAQQKNVEIAKSYYLPTLNASYTWSSFYNKIMGQAADAFSDQIKANKNQQLSFGLNIPVFNRLQVKNSVETAKLNVINSSYEKDIIINDLTKSIRSIKAQFLNAQEKYNLLEANFENQKLSFQKSEEKYKEGLMDAYTFFLVRNNWLQANYNLISSRNDVIQQTELLKVFEQD
ncbi:MULTISPECIES: TolC family protein [Chryseobacterium]|uniref:Outer membrane protein n=1 Tax=Chryseobacterium camelliae TaxID=1265445 RepID=A0ABU0TE32_9FLAO|nr:MULTISPECIES: TolC family protein [Chryseobacterium]MDQ1095336.1 outer membrane protein [Chryseobacterium camelliae]MDQ1099275.1 outer membrane protein [Chryseobacterium sp. SORGH_AS_1048]MDR6086624.1 outer membrane protein [Chryseobacterium sp. SORGH_AS_0909]MDT3406868.1 outer membrane protein [Pseudacidovorax intermedius]